jgi:membrane associated rhomboid family serine protease
MVSSTPVVNWIIKTNILVFILWYLFLIVDPIFMAQNFLVSWSGVLDGRVWTVVTSVFSHNLLFHLFINMYFFYGFGRSIETSIGSRRFFNLYMLSGIAGSFGHCLVSGILLKQTQLSALGASGAISGVLVFFSFMFPREKVYLLGLIPMPAFVGMLLFVGLDLFGLMAQTQGSQLPIGYGAHLGGALFGAVYFFHQKKRGLLRGPRGFYYLHAPM